MANEKKTTAYSTRKSDKKSVIRRRREKPIGWALVYRTVATIIVICWIIRIRVSVHLCELDMRQIITEINHIVFQSVVRLQV